MIISFWDTVLFEFSKRVLQSQLNLVCFTLHFEGALLYFLHVMVFRR